MRPYASVASGLEASFLTLLPLALVLYSSLGRGCLVSVDLRNVQSQQVYVSCFVEASQVQSSPSWLLQCVFPALERRSARLAEGFGGRKGQRCKRSDVSPDLTATDAATHPWKPMEDLVAFCLFPQAWSLRTMLHA